MKTTKDIAVHELDDCRMTLRQLRAKIDHLISVHGEDKIIYTDAGYNNVTFCLADNDEQT